MKQHLVVVGNGMAGMACVEQILRHAPRFDITVFGDETHVNYNRVLLSSVLAGEKAADDIVINPREWYEQHAINLRVGVRIVDVDGDARTVTGDDGSMTRYDVLLLINGVPVAQIELKTLGINPRRAIEQIVEYKNDPGNGYTRTLLCFVQLFIVSNRDSTYYFANNNARHFTFNADERFLPIYEFALPPMEVAWLRERRRQQYLPSATARRKRRRR